MNSIRAQNIIVKGIDLANVTLYEISSRHNDVASSHETGKLNGAGATGATVCDICYSVFGPVGNSEFTISSNCWEYDISLYSFRRGDFQNQFLIFSELMSWEKSLGASDTPLQPE